MLLPRPTSFLPAFLFLMIGRSFFGWGRSWEAYVLFYFLKMTVKTGELKMAYFKITVFKNYTLDFILKSCLLMVLVILFPCSLWEIIICSKQDFFRYFRHSFTILVDHDIHSIINLPIFVKNFSSCLTLEKESQVWLANFYILFFSF